jgi:hypothetical protein
MPSIRLSRKNHTERSAVEGQQLGPALGTQPGPNIMLQRTGGTAAVCNSVVQVGVVGGSAPAAEHAALDGALETAEPQKAVTCPSVIGRFGLADP